MNDLVLPLGVYSPGRKLSPRTIWTAQIDAIPRPNSELRDEHSLNPSKKPRANVPPGAAVSRAPGAPNNQPAPWTELDLALTIARRGNSSFGVTDRNADPSIVQSGGRQERRAIT